MASASSRTPSPNPSNQLKAVLIVADPALRERLSDLGNRELFRTCACLSPRDGEGDEDAVVQATRITLRLLAERIEQQIDELNQRLTGLVERHAPQLLAPVGIGPDSAVTLLITMGDNPERLSTEASFAALCGVSQSHRVLLGRARVGSTMAATGRRMPLCTASCSSGCATTRVPQAYYERRTQEGKTRREIIRCLKRYAAREVFSLVRTVYADPPL
ncbi:transposase [Streptomyces luteogriseus]|uniref:transposase n=1 Tax=Streptomyces luteogriseus TaxID=68233 RepID=UPI0037ABA590